MREDPLGFPSTCAGTTEAMGANLLVLLFPGASQTAMRQAIAEHSDGEPSVQVIAPTRVGPLEWLATDEDAARSQAETRALEAEWMLANEAAVEAEAGDVDPVLAVEDALRDFRADEILIVGGRSENGVLEASLRRFGLPVIRVGGSVPAPAHRELRDAVRAIVGGRSKATPFVFFAGSNLAMFALAVLIAAVVLLIVWVLP
jgi:hypothetical protein